MHRGYMTHFINTHSLHKITVYISEDQVQHMSP